MSMYFAGNLLQNLPLVTLTDTTAPTFAGIASLVANANGSLTASWAAATDTTNPIRYSVFIQAATATGLFVSANRVFSTFLLTQAIYELADHTQLQSGITYFVGIRAIDGVGNVETNTVSLSAASQGVPSTSLTNLINTVPGRVWDELLADHVTPGSVGANENLIDDIKGVVDNFTSADANHGIVVPAVITLPLAGSETYRFYFRNLALGVPQNPAAGPDIQIALSDGTIVLAFTAMTNEAAGIYYYDFVVSSTDAETQLIVKVRHKDLAPDPYTTLFATTDRTAVSASASAILAQTTAIKTKTDQLAFTSSRVDAVLTTAERDDIVDRVWDEAAASHVTAGTLGKRLDADATSRAAAATAVSSADLTPARSAKLDLVDVATSTRAPAATAVSSSDLTPTRAAKLDLVDVATSTRASPADVAAGVTTYDNLMSTSFDSLTDSQTILAWATKNGQRVSGTACTVVVKDNAAATVWTATLASPNADGVFKFNNVVALVGARDYYVVIIITVDAAVRTSQKPFVTVE